MPQPSLSQPELILVAPSANPSARTGRRQILDGAPAGISRKSEPPKSVRSKAIVAANAIAAIGELRYNNKFDFFCASAGCRPLEADWSESHDCLDKPMEAWRWRCLGVGPSSDDGLWRRWEGEERPRRRRMCGRPDDMWRRVHQHAVRSRQLRGVRRHLPTGQGLLDRGVQDHLREPSLPMCRGLRRPRRRPRELW